MMMKAKKTCGIILLMCMATILLRFRQHNVKVVKCELSRNLINVSSSQLSEELFNRKKLSGLQVLEPAQFINQPDVNCVNATIGNLRFPMCVYDAQDDIYVSKKVLSGQYWESTLVGKILNLFCMYPELSFVDLGANIGIYSLPIAHSGIHVVAVEPNNNTVRRLAKSVYLGRIEHNVDIFPYALSNKESTTFLKFDETNRGDTFMVADVFCPGCLASKVTVLNKLLPFMRHKKAFIKIDTQEAEIKIFQWKSAAQFLEEIDVVMILMEWDFYRTRYGNTEGGRRRVDRFLGFFFQRGYDVYDPLSEEKLDSNWEEWGFDVLFKKADLSKNRLFLL